MNETENSRALVLEPPKAIEVVEAVQAEGMVPIDQETRHSLDAKIDTFLDELLASEPGSEELRKKVESIHNLGKAEINASAAVSNRMLEQPMRALGSGIFDEKSPISSALSELRSTIEKLDPAQQDLLTSPVKLLGIIPFGNKILNYFRRYESAQTHLNGIISSLLSGQDELRKDNASIEQEKANLWDVMQKLEQYIYLGRKLDAAVEEKVSEIEAQSPEKARVVREELLFYLRQKVQDLLTQLAVSVQGYLALDMVRKNNLELIKGVDRATSTTISALRTAVIVAQALTNQRLVLNQIEALNTTTSNMIEGTSRLLKENTARTHAQASGSTVEIEKLKGAFQNIHETMSMISDFKIQALENMKQTVDILSGEIDKSKKYLDRSREREVSGIASEASGNQLSL